MVKKLAVIPAYNEEESIAVVIEGIKKLEPTFDILIVDDASNDRTIELAKKQNATVLEHPYNLGDGAARQTGFIYAKQNNYDIVVTLDGDGQHDPTSIRELSGVIESNEADIALGSRFLGTASYRINFFRRIGMRLYGLICSIFMRSRITDPTSGFRALNKKAINLFTTELYPQKYPDANVILLSHYAGLKVKEVPVRMNQNISGKSIHSGLRPLGYIYIMTLSIFMMLLRKRELIRSKDYGI
ncbi:MAG: glycosyltransferase family 2 protein [Actinobacteria bacterium]|nr:glycosyltransferase family 2 protein [Actinomycetota bacterium]